MSETLPGYILEPFRLSEQSDPLVHQLLVDASKKVGYSPDTAYDLLLEVLERAHQGADLGEYDYIVAFLLLIRAHEVEGNEQSELYFQLHQVLFAHMDQHFDEKAYPYDFRRDTRIRAYVQAANACAWQTYQQAGDDQKALGRALDIINRVKRFTRKRDFFYARDTEVRILQALGRRLDVFELVFQTQLRGPSGKFPEITGCDDYRAWYATRIEREYE